MLDFVVPPAAARVRRIGNSVCGVLEIEERGGLMVEEDDLIAELLEGGESAYVESAKAADAIAAAESVSLTEAFSIVRKSIFGEDLEANAEIIRIRHAPLIQHVAEVYARTGRRTMEASVTAIIKCRHKPEWTLQQTRKMDRTLYQGIYKLVLDEQTAEKMADEAPTEETLGKPPAGSRKRRARTGRQSSGSSPQGFQDSSPEGALDGS